ncbi:MAG: hypothetical protein QG585_384 [Patescibacteria group bacterium]|jgi:hypothetical protein|nr:hypothetical protein [Patescibacteria group bacterium]
MWFYIGRMKEVLVLVTAPDGTERHALVTCKTHLDFVMIRELLGQKLQGGEIHTVSTRIPEDHDRSHSVYRAADFLSLLDGLEWQEASQAS